MSTTGINWNNYVEVEEVEEIEEFSVEHEGTFTTVTLKNVKEEEFHQVYIGLYNGNFTKVDSGITLKRQTLSQEDLQQLVDVVGNPHHAF